MPVNFKPREAAQRECQFRGPTLELRRAAKRHRLERIVGARAVSPKPVELTVRQCRQARGCAERLARIPVHPCLRE